MSTNCFGFNLYRKKTKSTEKTELEIDSLQLDLKIELPKSCGTLSRKKSYSSALNNLEPTSAKSCCDEVAHIEEEIISEIDRADSITEVDEDISDKKSVRTFLGQDIAKIRAKKKPFEDSRFLRFVSSVVENQESQLYISLVSRLKAKSLVELNNLLQWKRIKVF